MLGDTDVENFTLNYSIKKHTDVLHCAQILKYILIFCMHFLVQQLTSPDH